MKNRCSRCLREDRELVYDDRLRGGEGGLVCWDDDRTCDKVRDELIDTLVAERDSLRLELDAERFCHIKNNELLIQQRDAALASAERLREGLLRARSLAKEGSDG